MVALGDVVNIIFCKYKYENLKKYIEIWIWCLNFNKDDICLLKLVFVFFFKNRNLGFLDK